MTGLLSITTFPCRAGQSPDFGSAALDRHHAQLTEDLLGFPEEQACVIMRWRGKRTPSGIAIGGQRITAATGRRLFAGTTQIGVFTRTLDGGDEGDAEHEILVLVTNSRCLIALRRELAASL